MNFSFVLRLSCDKLPSIFYGKEGLKINGVSFTCIDMNLQNIPTSLK